MTDTPETRPVSAHTARVALAILSNTGIHRGTVTDSTTPFVFRDRLLDASIGIVFNPVRGVWPQRILDAVQLILDVAGLTGDEVVSSYYDHEETSRRVNVAVRRAFRIIADAYGMAKERGDDCVRIPAGGDFTPAGPGQEGAA